MPLIPPSITSSTPLAFLVGSGSLAANATVDQRFQATIGGAGNLTANGSIAIAASATLSGSGQVDALGRLNAEANVLASATLSGSSDLSATAIRRLNGQANLSGAGQIKASPTLIPAESWETLVYFSAIPAISAGQIHIQSARITIGSQNIPIRQFTLAAPGGVLGKTLQVELAKPLKENLLIGNTFQFEIFDGGAWYPVLSGTIGQGGYTAEFNGRSLTLSSAGQIEDKFSKAVSLPKIFYDPSRTEEPQIDADALLRDEFGNVYVPDVIATAGLSFYSLLNYAAVTEAGFSGFQTNIPDFPIQQFQFEVGQSAISQVLSLVGFIEPLIVIEKAGKLQVLEMTAGEVLAATAAFDIPASDFLSIQLQTGGESGAVDGAIVQFAENGDGDYYVQRFETAEETTSGEQPVKISTVTEYRDYFTVADPFKPVKSLLASIERISERIDTAQIVGNEKTTYNYDSEGVLISTEKTIKTLAPALNAQTFILSETESEIQRLRYATAPTGERYLTARITETRGLVAIDSNQQFLDRPFKQPVSVSIEGGNFNWQMDARVEPIRTVFESFNRTKGGLTAVSTTVYDHLSNQVSRSSTLTEAGESIVRGRRRPARLIVYRQGFNPQTQALSNRLLSFSIGEMPLNKALPIIRRMINRRFEGKGTASIRLAAARLSIERGQVYRVLDVDAQAIGTFIVTGFQIQGSADGRTISIETNLETIEL